MGKKIALLVFLTFACVLGKNKCAVLAMGLRNGKNQMCC
jgi:hypothetical protein